MIARTHGGFDSLGLPCCHLVQDMKDQVRVERAKHGYLSKRGDHTKMFSKRLFRAHGTQQSGFCTQPCRYAANAGSGSAIKMPYWTTMHDVKPRGMIDLKVNASV